jgi:NAD-dependent dihydropyrimidine dehydrogenase PreA subunit
VHSRPPLYIASMDKRADNFNYFINFDLCVTCTVMVVASFGFAAYNIAMHEHVHPRHDLPYQHIRTKPYPWKCSDCNLFEGECWKECKASM